MPLRIIVVGPQSAGKSTFANCFAGLTKTADQEYIPTTGLRILETERMVHVGIENRAVSLEIWDLGGSKEYSTLWTRCAAQADGIIILLPAETEEPERAVKFWLSNIGGAEFLGRDQLTILLNARTSESRVETEESLSVFGGALCGLTTLVGEICGESANETFQRLEPFLSACCVASDRRIASIAGSVD